MTTVIEDPRTTIAQIGSLIRGARQNRGMTQTQLADLLSTSQSAIARIEQGSQNLSVEMLSRINEVLDADLLSIGAPRPAHLRVTGGQ